MAVRKSAPAWLQPFLDALARTGNVRVASAAAGVDYSTAYQRRQRDAGFRAAWARAVTAREAGEVTEQEGPLTPLGCAESTLSREGRGAEELVVRVLSGGGVGKLVRAGAGRWSKTREARFIASLAESANVRRAAAAAGISTQAIYARRLREPRFCGRWDAAIEAGKARLMAYLIEAADRTFDPEAAAAGDDLPRVSVAEAIGILRLKGGATSTARGGHGDESDEEDGAANVNEAGERIIARLERMRDIDREKKLAAGWSECDGEWVPPGFARLAGPGE